jgi:hypothetical protein
MQSNGQRQQEPAGIAGAGRSDVLRHDVRAPRRRLEIEIAADCPILCSADDEVHQAARATQAACWRAARRPCDSTPVTTRGRTGCADRCSISEFGPSKYAGISWVSINHKEPRVREGVLRQRGRGVTS